MAASFNHLKTPQRLIKTPQHEISLSIYFTRAAFVCKAFNLLNTAAANFSRNHARTQKSNTTIRECVFYFHERARKKRVKDCWGATSTKEN
jgi:hypothetical protein